MDGLDSKRVLVGAGGWLGYKKDKVPTDMRLRAYSSEFDFVEVNSLFYRIIHPQTIERWRKSVPAEFEFSIKCNQGLTHKVGLRPVEDAFRVFGMMQRYCEILQSKILVMQMPPGLKLNEKFVSQARDFFNSTNLGGLRVAIEFRVSPARIPYHVVSMLRDFNMIHAMDLSFEDPRLESDLLYSRVFGRPQKQYALDNNDLERIKQKVHRNKSQDVRIIGHSLKMIEDARRIKKALY